MKKGKLIVIDGTDGSGKQTQTKLLMAHLRKEGYTVKTLAFPQYHTKSAGLVENYLEGKYGKKADDVSPYVASLFYALDRFDAARSKIDKWLAKGYVVVLDRYVSANMGHQGTKMKTSSERKKFFKWLTDLEYGLLALPRPDLQLIFYVDPKISQALATKKWKNKVTNLQKTDIHEVDLDHLTRAAAVYREMASLLPQTKLIDCIQEDAMLSRSEIHDMVWLETQKMLKREERPVFDFEESKEQELVKEKE